MNSSLRASLSFAAAFGASVLLASASPHSYDFKDSKGVNNVQFSLDAPLESIAGTDTGIYL